MEKLILFLASWFTFTLHVPFAKLAYSREQIFGMATECCDCITDVNNGDLLQAIWKRDNQYEITNEALSVAHKPLRKGEICPDGSDTEITEYSLKHFKPVITKERPVLMFKERNLKPGKVSSTDSLGKACFPSMDQMSKGAESGRV